MTDFFISYTKVDKTWAEWVAWVLEEEGYSVLVEAWDFRPGANFMVAMDQTVKEAQRVIAILSPDYGESVYGKTEWAAVMAGDPIGLQGKLVPVRVAPCEPKGLLRSISWIDLVGLDEEKARAQLVDGVRNQRMKPDKPPLFPGARHHRTSTHQPAFPVEPAMFIPRLPTRTTELDLRRFMKSSFDGIRKHFEQWLAALKTSDSRFDTEFHGIDAMKFLAEVYVDGEKRSGATVELTSQFGTTQQITYSEGIGAQEILSAHADSEGIHLEAMVGALSMGSAVQHLDLKRMTADQAADYLWRRLLQRVEQASSGRASNRARPLAPILPVVADALSPPRSPPQTAKIELWREYPREQIPPFFGLEFTKALWHAGFVPFADQGQVFLLVTLEKRTMEERHQYEDQFLSPGMFQWQSQNRTARDSKHGRLLKNHVSEGAQVHLFVRAEKKLRSGNGAPFIYCGPVRFESWHGDQPITVLWKLDEPVPKNLRAELKVPTGS